MVRVINRPPSGEELIAQGFGRGLLSGTERLLAQREKKQFLKKQQKFQKELQQLKMEQKANTGLRSVEGMQALAEKWHAEGRTLEEIDQLLKLDDPQLWRHATKNPPSFLHKYGLGGTWYGGGKEQQEPQGMGPQGMGPPGQHGMPGMGPPGPQGMGTQPESGPEQGVGPQGMGLFEEQNEAQRLGQEQDLQKQQFNQILESLSPIATEAHQNQDLDTGVGSAVEQLGMQPPQGQLQPQWQAPGQRRPDPEGEGFFGKMFRKQREVQAWKEAQQLETSKAISKALEPNVGYLSHRAAQAGTNIAGFIPYQVANIIESTTGNDVAVKFKGDLLKLQHSIIGDEPEPANDTVKRIGNVVQGGLELLGGGVLGKGLAYGTKGIPYVAPVTKFVSKLLNVSAPTAFKMIGAQEGAKKLAQISGAGPNGEAVAGVLGTIGYTGFEVWRGLKAMRGVRDALYKRVKGSQELVPWKLIDQPLKEVTLGIRNNPTMKGIELVLKEAEVLQDKFFGSQVSMSDLNEQKQVFNAFTKDVRLSGKAKRLAAGISNGITKTYEAAAQAGGKVAEVAKDVIKANGIHSYLANMPSLKDYGRGILRRGLFSVPMYAAAYTLGLPVRGFLGPLSVTIIGKDLFKFGMNMILADPVVAKYAGQYLRAAVINNVAKGAKAMSNMNKRLNRMAQFIVIKGKGGKKQLVLIDPRTGKVTPSR